MGAELEYVLPFNKRKWCFIFNPSYVSYSGSARYENRVFDVDYQALELPLGVKHNFYFKDNIVFISAAFMGSKNLNTMFTISQDYFPPEVFDLRSNMNYVIGVGVLLKNRINAEIKYFTPRHIMVNYNQWYSSFRSIAVTFGYKIF